MAQQEYIPVLDDGEILSPSPLIILDTAYYELWLNINGAPAWTQSTYPSPLPIRSFSSPAISAPYIATPELADATTYNYKIRRFNHTGAFSNWVTGSFTTA